MGNVSTNGVWFGEFQKIMFHHKHGMNVRNEFHSETLNSIKGNFVLRKFCNKDEHQFYTYNEWEKRAKSTNKNVT